MAHPTAKTTGGDDIAGSWTRSTSTAGYFQTDYQVHAATTGTAWARWTPRVPSAGCYNVYLRWTSGWNRASNAKVTINTPAGQVIARVDQRSNGGLWMKVGRYYFQAGAHTRHLSHWFSRSTKLLVILATCPRVATP